MQAIPLVFLLVWQAGSGVTTSEEAAGLDLVSPSPGLEALADDPESELHEAVRRYTDDRRGLLRRYDIPGSTERRERLRRFYREWQQALEAVDFESLGQEGRIDWLLLHRRVRSELSEIDRLERIWSEAAALLPFGETVIGLQETRRRRETTSGQAAATALDQMSKAIETTQKALERGLAEEQKEKQEEAESAATEDRRSSARQRRPQRGAERGSESATESSAGPPEEGPEEGAEEGTEKQEPSLRTTKTIAHRAARLSGGLRSTLKGWFEYHAGYDPVFTWWVKDPYQRADKALEGYVDFLRKKILGVKEGEDPPIVGDPIGREALLEQLAGEMIAYTPEELVAMAREELAWCEEEMRKAAREMGFGDDWKAALEKVKTLHVEPGRQPELVRDLAYEAIDYLEERDLLTIPPLAKELWRMEMMSPERQKMNPFFTGGEVIRVSYPTDTMSHEEKQMSLRGNNAHFSRATVHHELIPGHHLQGFMTNRYNSHRQAFSTPFWGEGWALYWELLLWDLGFPRGPEDRIGMLFWRMHRCARVIWSLGFHLGDMTPEESVEFLVERIGHERENALGEVRRSFEGSYSPLYQVAYLMGGFQFRALRRELVESGQMSDRELHDRILRGGRMPVEMVRARLLGLDLGRDLEASWRYQRR